MSYHKLDKIKKINTGKNNKYNKNQKPKTPKKITESYLHNSGLYYLERFSASKNHFKFVMKRKVKRSCMHHKDQDYDMCAAMVDNLANKFEQLGLLDDNLYTNGLVASLRRKGMSRNAIKNKMRAKGIDADKTIIALNKLDDENNNNPEDGEINAALKLAKKKKIGPYFTKKEQDIKKSLGIFARAGFSYQIAQNILNISIDDIDNNTYF